MRRLGRALVLVLLLGIGAWAAMAGWPRVALFLAGSHGGPGSDDARSTQAYTLPPGKDVEFVLARHPSRVRIAIVPLVPAGRPPDGEAGWSLHWELLDGRGARLGGGLQEGQCRAPATWTDEDARVRPTRWASDAAQQPCSDRLLFLRLGDTENAARVRLRLLGADPAYRGIAVRVSQRVARSHRGDAGVAWQRMNEASRAEQARYHPYPHFLLTPEEIAAVTAHEWRPVGPQGVAGEDFSVITLFYMPADERVPYVGDTVAGRVADATQRVTLPVHEAGTLALRLVPLAREQAPVAGQLVLHPTLPWAPSTLPLVIPAEGLVVNREVARGLAEISTQAPVAVDIVSADVATIAHETHRLRLLRLDDGAYADWPVAHAAGATTAFRLDVRGHRDATGQGTGARDGLEWQWLDATGAVLRRGTLAPPTTPSPYDRPDDGGMVTEPASAWFRLPPQVASVRVTARGTLLASAWSRVDDRALPRRVPGELRAWFDDPHRLPEWFRLDPADWAARVADGRSRLLHVQHRPLPPLRAGDDTLVDTMAPEQAGALAARLVLPLASVPFRLAPSPANLFAPLDPGCHATLVAARGERQVSPQLLFIGGQSLAPASVVIDGQPLELPAPAGTAGTRDLPPLSAGRHRLCIADEGGRRWYVSHAAPGAQRHVEAGGYWIDGTGPLSVVVDKGADPVTLTIRYYGSDRATTPTVLRAEVEGIPAHGVFDGYTTSRVAWTLPAVAGALPGHVLQRGGARVAAPQGMNLVLDNDLPPGRWRIRFTLAGGNPGYLAVSRLEQAAAGATRVLHEVP